ncbi:MAG: hypothetical protein AB7U85_10050 [Alphaproteobacteria bacterium]
MNQPPMKKIAPVIKRPAVAATPSKAPPRPQPQQVAHKIPQKVPPQIPGTKAPAPRPQQPTGTKAPMVKAPRPAQTQPQKAPPPQARPPQQGQPRPVVHQAKAPPTKAPHQAQPRPAAPQTANPQPQHQPTKAPHQAPPRPVAVTQTKSPITKAPAQTQPRPAVPQTASPQPQRAPHITPQNTQAAPPPFKAPPRPSITPASQTHQMPPVPQRPASTANAVPSRPVPQTMTAPNNTTGMPASIVPQRPSIMPQAAVHNNIAAKAPLPTNSEIKLEKNISEENTINEDEDDSFNLDYDETTLGNIDIEDVADEEDGSIDDDYSLDYDETDLGNVDIEDDEIENTEEEDDNYEEEEEEGDEDDFEQPPEFDDEDELEDFEEEADDDFSLASPTAKTPSPKVPEQPDDDFEYLSQLSDEESSLYDAYKDTMSMTKEIAIINNCQYPSKNIGAKDLVPHLKPDVAMLIKDDMYKSLAIFKSLYPKILGRVTGQESDQTFFAIAEAAKDEIIQSFIFNFMQVDIEIEACKIRSKASKVVKESKMLKEEAVDLFLEQQSLANSFIKKLKRRNLPINEEALIKNYLKAADNDPESAYRTLISNPAFFTPILVDKMPKKFFGLIKANAKDCKAMNKKIANIMKTITA